MKIKLNILKILRKILILFYFFRYVELLINNPLLVEYIDTVLRDERISLIDPIILKFLEIYYPKVCALLFDR